MIVKIIFNGILLLLAIYYCSALFLIHQLVISDSIIITFKFKCKSFETLQ